MVHFPSLMNLRWNTSNNMFAASKPDYVFHHFNNTENVQVNRKSVYWNSIECLSSVIWFRMEYGRALPQETNFNYFVHKMDSHSHSIDRYNELNVSSIMWCAVKSSFHFYCISQQNYIVRMWINGKRIKKNCLLISTVNEKSLEFSLSIIVKSYTRSNECKILLRKELIFFFYLVCRNNIEYR